MASDAGRLLSMTPERTGLALRKLRQEQGTSLRALAPLVHRDYSWLSRVESLKLWPRDRSFAEQADIALNAGGRLVAAWDADQRELAARLDTVKQLDQARKDAEQLLTLPDAADLDQINADIIDVAENARRQPYDVMLPQALRVRSELMRRLKETAYRPDQLRDTLLALGRVSGLLSYLTLDLGQSDAAKVHAAAAFTLGDRAGDDHLRAWARGTQSLAFRFDKQFDEAAWAASDGLQYAGESTGTARARLLCGLAASVARQGDSERAMRLLQEADTVREHSQPDQLPGLFTFSEAKQTYYHGFSLMWAPDKKILTRSASASEAAITEWQRLRGVSATDLPPDSMTGLGDEMLSQIYLATAQARLGNLDESIAAVQPVLDLPMNTHFSWVRKRLNELDGLWAKHFPDSLVAEASREVLKGYVLAR